MTMSSTHRVQAVFSLALLTLTAAARGEDAKTRDALAASPRAVEPDDTLVYVGTYTGEKSKGIYRYRLVNEGQPVPQNVTLEPLGLAAEVANPSFLEIDAKRRLLFAVNEVREVSGARGGAVTAYRIEPDGKLTL